MSGKSHLGVFWAKGAQQTGTLFERWNTYSRVRVTAMGESVPFGWGFSRTPTTKIDQKYLDIDADAATVITRFDGDLGKFGYLKDDVINGAYLVQPTSDVAVVGVGGGRDVLSALLFGAKKISGIEINPAIFEVLTDKFADFSGHLDKQPGVSLINAEARSYINHSSDRYDLVQISLIDTWAATAAGGLTLTENRLYTVEAWGDFYRALKPRGMLSVSRWYDAGYPSRRILSPGLDRGRCPAAHRRARRRPERPSDRAQRRQHRQRDHAARRLHLSRMAGRARAAEAQGFKILMGPDIAFDAVTTKLISGTADAAYFASLPENVTPSTDDNPFFFYTARFGDFVAAPMSARTHNNTAITMTLALIAVALVACLFYVVGPFIRLARRRRWRR